MRNTHINKPILVLAWVEVQDRANTNRIQSGERQLCNPHHLFVSCNGKSSSDQQWSRQLDPRLKAYEKKHSTQSTALSLRLGCHSGSWNHICYLYVPLRHPARYFRKATATVTGTIFAYWNAAVPLSIPSRLSACWGGSWIAKPPAPLFEMR